MTDARQDTTTKVPTCLGDLTVRVVGSGPPALLWHSLVVGSEEWVRVLPGLARQRALIMVDGPGHGSSQPPPSLFTSAQCADAAMTVLDALGVAVADWVGEGWGARVGLVAAARYPDRVRSLALLGSLDLRRVWWRRAVIRMLLVVQLVVGSVAPLVEFLMIGTLGPRRRRYDAEAAVVVSGGALRLSRLGIFRVGMSELRPTPPAETIGRHIVCPMVVLGGAHSAPVARQYASALTAAALDASMEVIDHVFNLIALEHPERTIEVVSELWLRSEDRDLSP